jgi:heme/copper-type cytochrome/quinol oxidase subunit 2
MEKENESTPILSTADWLIIIFLLIIPFVNLVMLLVWSFRKSTNPNKSNFSKALLIWFLIFSTLIIILFAISGITIFGLMGDSPDFIDNPVY